jgi:hypothetical protein
MVSLIDAEREEYGVESICRQLPIAPSNYHEWKAREIDPSRLPERTIRDAELREQIERVWKENFGVYGARKVWRQLRREGIDVAPGEVRGIGRDLRGHLGHDLLQHTWGYLGVRYAMTACPACPWVPFDSRGARSGWLAPGNLGLAVGERAKTRTGSSRWRCIAGAKFVSPGRYIWAFGLREAGRSPAASWEALEGRRLAGQPAVVGKQRTAAAGGARIDHGADDPIARHEQERRVEPAEGDLVDEVDAEWIPPTSLATGGKPVWLNSRPTRKGPFTMTPAERRSIDCMNSLAPVSCTTAE